MMFDRSEVRSVCFENEKESFVRIKDDTKKEHIGENDLSRLGIFI